MVKNTLANKARRRHWRLRLLPMVIVGLGVLFGGLGAGQGVSLANDDAEKQWRAEQLRRASKARAAAKLYYPEIFDSDQGANRQFDYFALSLAIQRLAAVIEEMEQSQRRQPMSFEVVPAFPDQPLQREQVINIYGPDGPTKQSVSMILNYWLMVGGNPRVKVGDVEDRGDTITATIVTADGSLVEEFHIDKQHGDWKPIRPEK